MSLKSEDRSFGKQGKGVRFCGSKKGGVETMEGAGGVRKVSGKGTTLPQYQVGFDEKLLVEEM